MRETVWHNLRLHQSGMLYVRLLHSLRGHLRVHFYCDHQCQLREDLGIINLYPGKGAPQDVQVCNWSVNVRELTSMTYGSRHNMPCSVMRVMVGIS